MSWTTGVRIPARENFYLLHSVQTSSWANPASYPVGTGGSFPWLKGPEREAHHSPPTNAEIKNSELYLHSPIYLNGIVLH
jgi:hypothetical protein